MTEHTHLGGTAWGLEVRGSVAARDAAQHSERKVDQDKEEEHNHDGAERKGRGGGVADGDSVQEGKDTEQGHCT